MNRPENTAERDPVLHVLGAMGTGGISDYITDMEANGQRQLVSSESLPSRTQDGDQDYLAAGFTFGEPDGRDSLFRPATLPEGWRKVGSDHSMWSYIQDHLGRRRVAIFYKAAWYDRDAFMRMETVTSYAYGLFDHGGTPVFDDWCTPEAFAEAIAGMRQRITERVDLYASKLGDPAVSWAADSLAEARAELEKHDRWAEAVTTDG